MATGENKNFLCSWKIENYSFAYQRCGQCIRSPLFKVGNLGGSEWTILLYPRGYSRYMSVSVACVLYRYQYNEGDESEEKITIDLRFELASLNGNTVKICDFQNQEILRGAKSKEFELVKIDELQEEMELWSVDTLVLRCYLIKTHNVLPFVPSGTQYSSCEAFTEICVDNFKHNWIIRIPESSEWSRKKEIIFPEMLPVVLNYKVVGDQICVEVCSTVKYKYSRFISCIVTFLDSKGRELLSKTSARLFSNETWELPGVIHKSVLDLTTCQPHNDIKLKIEVSSTNDSIFSRIDYCNEHLSNDNGNKLQNSKVPCAAVRLNPKRTSATRTDSIFHLQNHLKNMFADSKFTDVNLKADDEVIPAHKALLAARSPVFCAMFEQDMLESKTGIVEIPDVEPITLKLFLEYLYSGTVNEMDDENAINLMVIADKYEVLSLKEMCSGYLGSVMSLNNVCNVLYVADLVNDATLKSAASDYIVRHSLKVLPSPEWSTWVENNVKLATELFFKLSQKLSQKVYLVDDQ